MLASFLAPRLARFNIHYGWVIVAVTFLTMLSTAGAMGLPGALILPLDNEFGWGVSAISSALALRLALFGLMGPFSAGLIERYGVRAIVLTAISLLIIGLLSALRFMMSGTIRISGLSMVMPPNDIFVKLRRWPLRKASPLMAG